MLKRFPVYPFLIGIYPVLALGAYNISQIVPRDILRPLLLSLLAAGFVFGLARILLREWHRAALVAALVLLLFFSYGQVYAGAKLMGITFLRHRVLLAVWGVLLIAGIVYVVVRLKDPAAWTAWLNLISALILIYPVLMIFSNVAPGWIAQRAAGREGQAAGLANPGSQPDIYYMLLDSYAREDSLREDFAFDNSAFMGALKERGFYVAECAQSNYSQTAHSVSTALNFDYLEKLPLEFGKSQRSEGILLQHSAVRAFLEERGYKTIAFATGFPFSEIRDAYRFMEPAYRNSVATPFEALFANTTLLRVATDFGRLNLEAVSQSEYFRQRTMLVFESLKELPDEDGDYFVYAHIILPHPPYVFGPRGEKVYYGEYSPNRETLSHEQIVVGYRDQVSFANQETLKTVDAILQNSRVAPIIIIQGDHGAPAVGHSDRMRILNAYYAPNAAKVLYRAITPVNSFRVILNAYFGQDFPLLQDRSYFTNYGDWANFQEIPPSCPGQ